MDIGQYDHLDDPKYNPVQIRLPIPQLVEIVRTTNYGEHRFLSELVRQRETSDDYKQHDEYRRHTVLLRKLIEEDGYY